MQISNVTITENYNSLDCDVVEYTLTTERGSVDLMEWVNLENGKWEVESVDTNTRAYEIEKLTPLFDVSGKPGLMPFADFLPISEFLNLVQIEIDKLA